MKSPIALILFFSLALYTSGTNARKGPEEYWRAVMKDEPMPEAIQHLMPQHSSVPPSKEKTDCHHTSSSVGGAEDSGKSFEPRPNATVYHDDTKLKENESFEPRPNATVYHEDGADLKQEKPLAGDFEPRPSITVYHD